MKLARLQQFTTVSLLLAAVFWAAVGWQRSPALGLVCFGLVVSVHAWFLAIEFIVMRHVNRHDPAPQAGWAELLGAWWGESLQAPRVFCWRQPFRSQAEPDFLPGNGRRGVVFIHGFVCNRGLWTPWLTRLRAEGHAFVAVNLEPVFGSIDDYPPLIEAAVQAVQRDTGQPPVLVCHSMGGLAARAWLRWRAAGGAGGASPVQHVVTIGTPHHGTWLGRFSHVTNGRQMRLASDWLSQLAPGEPVADRIIQNDSRAAAPPFTCWYSNCDNIVFPVSSATLPGADNRLVHGTAHVHLAFHPAIVQHSLALLA